jgi:hypothetical protein
VRISGPARKKSEQPGQQPGSIRQAKQNTPSVIFIDDSDVLFDGRESHGPGLYRYLLDGLECETAGRVAKRLTEELPGCGRSRTAPLPLICILFLDFLRKRCLP